MYHCWTHLKNRNKLYIETASLGPFCPTSIEESKHLKGQLDPPVGNGHVFWTKGGQLDPPVREVIFFWTNEGQLDAPVGDVMFLDQRWSVGSPCW